MHIDDFSLRIIYNSRVEPTVEAEVNGVRAAAPSGASTGTHEALCFVPDDLERIETTLQDRLTGESLSQDEFDAALEDVDGTDNFAEIGAVAIASSLAFWKAQERALGDRFPYPAGNLVGGGEHGGNTSIQEFLVIPAGASSIPEAMDILSQVYHEFHDRYSRRITGINDEGAYITDFNDEETLDAVTEVAEDHGAQVGIDAAASEFYDRGEYRYGAMGQEFSPDEQLKFMEKLVERFDLAYVEDPFDEEDFERLAQLTDRVNDALVVGDDVFVTDAERLQRGAGIGAGNSLIVKPNQAGTVSRTRETVEAAQDNGYVPVVSHRSGETCDATISDLALAWNAPLLKAGIAGIRTAKNNQLLRRWDERGGTMAQVEAL
ncbi:MAG: enolase C-terminal domain-like protein [Candidatus Nanohaloarchaea archaeon]|nr:enolase C-terminal domain-like protein [Candidatus Nanohaloarchaea archaeon]